MLQSKAGSFILTRQALENGSDWSECHRGPGWIDKGKTDRLLFVVKRHDDGYEFFWKTNESQKAVIKLLNTLEACPGAPVTVQEGGEQRQVKTLKELERVNGIDHFECSFADFAFRCQRSQENGQGVLDLKFMLQGLQARGALVALLSGTLPCLNFPDLHRVILKICRF